MDRIQSIISQIRVYAAQTGTSPQAVCRKATGNPYLFKRLMRRDEETDVLIARILAHINAGANSVGSNERNAKRLQKKPAQKDMPDAIGAADE